MRGRLFVLGALWFLLGQISAAQISPGVLSRAHQSLDGATQCAACHQFGGEAVFRCLDCHKEIATRLSARRGLHASYGIPAGSSQPCVRCHSEHNGRDFAIVKWNPQTFDHKQTGYALEGKHAGLSCDRCHTPQHIAPQERALIQVKDLNRTYLGISSACTTCHQDPHSGRLGRNCLQCHNYEDWQAVAKNFDHSQTRYPLTGLHTQVTCEKCHTPGPDKEPRYAGLPFGQCSDCHSDPHHGSFGKQTCQSCHNTSGWKRVSTAALGKSFDHSKTNYPLLGKHQEVDCLQCHHSGDFKRPLAFQKCMDCHQDEHQGQFVKRADGGECSSCHTVEGFKPAKFGLKEHAATAYPLQGKHATLQCSQCHIPRGKETLYKIKFDRCLDCHQDEHQGQFAAAPHFNRCEECHTLDGYRPSTFGLEQHKKTRFVLTEAHLAVTCAECHKPAQIAAGAKATERYRFQNLSCAACHEDPHHGEFRDRMERAVNGRALGCEACHSTKSWNDLARFDHDQTAFPLRGEHRAVACMDCHKPPNFETTLKHVDFRAAPQKCEECHEDIHGGQFAKANGVTSCAECHNSARWKPSLFDHDKRTAFPLAGAHRAVACDGCHKLTRVINAKTVLFYRPTPKDCAACHGADPVAGKNNGK